ncbi:class I SAM-dependent methyltransferase [Candidatus Woesearchaeota archaeon]|nr:class I SAM-dependent methyltransferase [Candidatus Woesearchaeota archaeon]
MKLKGVFKRFRKEIFYVKRKKWNYKDVGDFWNTVHDYDEIDNETYAYKRRFYDSFKMQSISSNSNILDIDCRTGNGSVFYHKNGKINQVTCVSPSNIFLDVCKKRLTKYQIKGNFILLRKLPLPLRSQTFDASLCFETIEHISNHKEFLAELNRLLKKNGELILTMPNILWEPIHWFSAVFGIHHSEGPHKFLRRRKLLTLLKKTGFKVIKQKTTVLIPAGPKQLTRLGELLEKILGKNIMHLIGLRHIFICKKEF